MHSPAAGHEQAPASCARLRGVAIVVLGALAAAFVPNDLGPGRSTPAFAAAQAAEAPRPDRKPAARKKPRMPRDASYGREGDPKKVTRTIKIQMSDTMRYFPDHVTVKKGQTVRFSVHNAGGVPHEMMLGTMDDLKQNAAMSRQNADTADDEPYVARVEPGETGRIVWQFTRAGEFYYGCLVPGHFEAGMIGTIVVR